MKIRTNDTVMVMKGAYKGKTGKVVRAYPAIGKVLIDGINMRKKHMRPRQEGKKGQMVEKAYPIDVSNVMILDPKDNKPSRIGKSKVGEKWLRVARRSGSTLDK